METIYQRSSGPKRNTDSLEIPKHFATKRQALKSPSSHCHDLIKDKGSMNNVLWLRFVCPPSVKIKSTCHTRTLRNVVWDIIALIKPLALVHFNLVRQIWQGSNKFSKCFLEKNLKLINNPRSWFMLRVPFPMALSRAYIQYIPCSARWWASASKLLQILYWLID